VTTFGEILENVVLMFICYGYILIIIVVSGKLDGLLNISQKTARKFLHIMIGNLPFIIPFFSLTIFPTFVAAPFILVTFLATPYSPFTGIGKKLKGLSILTEKGHQWGLVFYAIAYTVLAFLFGGKPQIIAAGILPMAYGDAAASIVGQKYGRHRYKLVADKSFEGSLAMFLTCLASLAVSMFFFSYLYGFPFFSKGVAVLAASAVTTVVEGLSPLGFDNLTVPALSVLTFLLYGGGI
jgi:phytol kinase